MGLFGTNLFLISDCVSVSTFCLFVDNLWLLLENSPFRNLWRINCLGWNFVQCSRIHFIDPAASIPHQDYEHSSFYKKSSLFLNGWCFRNWKIAAYLQMAKSWNFLTRIWQNLLFYQQSQPLYDVMQKEIENLEFVSGVKFEIIDSLKNIGTKLLTDQIQLILTTPVKRFAFQKPLLTLSPLEDIGVRAQST